MTATETGIEAVGEATLAELAEGLHGELVTPASEQYEEARSIWNAAHDRRPALVIRCAGVSDVIRGVDFARSEGLPLALRGGGHSIPGFSTTDGGVVLDLSPMKGIRVDRVARRVVAQAGCLWSDLDQETQEFGLALTGGLVSTTGIAGFTLGGGIGWLLRSCGLTCDSLVGADVVTADGQLVHASADEHPDLFWALRGGGGNFGVVTSFEYALHEVGPTVGGPTFWPIELGGTVLAAYREFLPAAPRECSGFFAFVTVPPGPPFPEPLHMRKACGVVWCHTGDEAAAARDMQPLLDALPEPLLHGVQPMPHPVLQSAFDG